MNRRRLRQRGFSLFELLTMLVIFGLIALAGGRLFESAVRLNHSGAEVQNDDASFDAATSALRADAWSASAFDVANGKTATIHLPGDRKIVWTLNDGLLARTIEGQPTGQWPIAPGVTFATDGPALALRIPATKLRRGGELRVVSQIQLLTKAAS